jgi:hypothetical protein
MVGSNYLSRRCNLDRYSIDKQYFVGRMIKGGFAQMIGYLCPPEK